MDVVDLGTRHDLATVTLSSTIGDTIRLIVSKRVTAVPVLSDTSYLDAPVVMNVYEKADILVCCYYILSSFIILF